MSAVRRDRVGVGIMVAILVLLIALPAFGSQYFVEFVMTQALILGLAASTLIFLSAYGGMVSLAQLLMYGIAGFAIGNAVAEEGSTKGLTLGLNPWVAVVAALVITTVVALVLGALSSRTYGIYFLMLTLTYAVIGYYVFGQVTTSLASAASPASVRRRCSTGRCGSTTSASCSPWAPTSDSAWFGVPPSAWRSKVFVMIRFGWHRWAFTFRCIARWPSRWRAFVAAMAGIVNVWWNGQIDPNTISIGATIDLLVIAVIGGIGRLEGAWLGALVFVMAKIYLRDLPFADRLGLTEARFNTVVGLLVLAIVVLSPDGLMGIILRARDRSRGSPADRARRSSALPGPSDGEVLANTP